MDWRDRVERVRERLAEPLPDRPATQRDQARGAACLLAGTVLMLLGVALLGGRPGGWPGLLAWEPLAGFALVGASLYVVQWGLLAHQRP